MAFFLDCKANKLTKYESMLSLSVVRDIKLAINVQAFSSKEPNNNAELYMG